MTALWTVVRAYVDVTLLRRGPRDLPASTVLLAVTAAAYFGLNLLLALLDSAPPAALLLATVNTALPLLFAMMVLRLARLSHRTLQTLTALAGAGSVLDVAGLPLVLWLARTAPGTAVPDGVLLLWLALLLWSLLVSAHVYRQALDTTLLNGFMLTLACLALTVPLVRLTLQATAPGAAG